MIRGQRETELERPLSETEVEAILKQLGSPLVVAHRFLPERFLIGPVLFPLYLFVLKIAVACALAPAVLAWLAMLVTGPYTATAPTWLHALRSVASSCWTAVFASAGIVTIAFAVLDRVQTKTRFLDEFNPRKIPAVRDPSLIPRTGSFVELAFYLAGVIFWVADMLGPIISFYPGMQIALSPRWSYLFWGFLSTLLGGVVLAAVNLFRPHWRLRRAAARLALDCAGGVLFCWLFKANIVTGFAVQGLSAAQGLAIAHSINWWLATLFPWGVVAVILTVLSDVYRIVRLKAAQAKLTHGLAAAL